MTESERQRMPDLCSREAEGNTTMLFSFDGGDAKSHTMTYDRFECMSHYNFVFPVNNVCIISQDVSKQQSAQVRDAIRGHALFRHLARYNRK